MTAPAEEDRAPSLLTGVSAGLQAFGDAAWGWVRLGLALGAITLVAFVAAATLSPPWWDETGSPWAPAFLLPELALTVLTILMTMATAAVALHQMRTRELETALAWRVLRRGPVWAMTVPVGVVTVLLDTAAGWLWVGSLLSVPFLVYPPFLLADGHDAGSAVRDGLRLLAVRPGQQVLLLAVTSLLVLAGLLVCFVGLLAALPVCSLAYAWAYCHLTRRPADPAGAPG